MTLYEELELSPDCSFDDIKQQYRTLAMKYHPDHGGDVDKFQRIKHAYEVLSDPDRRKHYDETKSTEEFNLKGEAMTTLANIFFAIIPSFNCESDDLVARMKKEVDSLKEGAKIDIERNKTFIKNLETVKNKLKLKNPNDDNIIMSFLDQQLEFRYKDRNLYEKRIKLSDEMMLVLDKYSYGFLELVNDVTTLPSEVPN
jgi:curved DNA-binding protein CbpA